MMFLPISKPQSSHEQAIADLRTASHPLRPASRVILARSSDRLLGPLLLLAVSQLYRRPR